MCHRQSNTLPAPNRIHSGLCDVNRTVTHGAGISSIGVTVKIPKDLTGKKFGRLSVIGFSRNDRKIGNFWQCVCDCGNKCEKQTRQLQDKHNKNPSCGCAKRDSIKIAASIAAKSNTKFSHPHKLKLKWAYRNMLNRCFKIGTRRFERYGGRGISVCELWRRNSTEFYIWAINSGYSPDLQINRIDNDGNYSPENCNWVTRIEQQQNTGRSHFLEWGGKNLTVAEWSRQLGVNPRAIQHRLSRGWSIERIFTQPFRSRI